MQGTLEARAKLASPARKEDEERDEKGSQKLIGRLDRPHQQLFQQHRPTRDMCGSELLLRKIDHRALFCRSQFHVLMA
jgi:hypothetical protein